MAIWDLYGKMVSFLVTVVLQILIPYRSRMKSGKLDLSSENHQVTDEIQINSAILLLLLGLLEVPQKLKSDSPKENQKRKSQRKWRLYQSDSRLHRQY